MRMGRGFPQRHYFSNLSVIGNETGRDSTGRGFPSYPHLWITLWIMEPASVRRFSEVDRNFLSEFNRLDEEATCG